MKLRTIAYFDILGYKDFIFSEPPETLPGRIGHIMRDIEHSLTLDAQGRQVGGRLFADFKHAKANVHFISDTIIFFSENESYDEMMNVLKVAYSFNAKINKINFPTRGCVLIGEMEVIQNFIHLESGNSYSISCPYGRGLVEAHLKAENKSWAATIIDKSIIDRIKNKNYDFSIIEKISSSEKVPRKRKIQNEEMEYVMRIIENSGFKAFEHTKEFLEMIFRIETSEFKSNDRAQEIFDNTLELYKRQILNK